MNTIKTIDDLPVELMDYVFLPLVDVKDLLNAARTNRRFANVCRRAIYHTILLEDVRQAALCFRTLAKSTECAHLVRNLTARNFAVGQTFLAFKEASVKALRNLIRLESLSCPESYELFVYVCLHHFPTLQSCGIPYLGRLSTNFLDRHPNLRTVQIPATESMVLPWGDLDAIPVLRLPLVENFVGPPLLAQRLLTHSRVTHLMLIWNQLNPDANLAAAVFQAVNSETDTELISCTNLVKHWDLTLLPAIAKHASNVQVVCIFNNQPSSAEELQDFLHATDASIASMSCLTCIQIGNLRRIVPPDTSSVASLTPDILGELAHVRRWGTLCSTLVCCGLEHRAQWIRLFSSLVWLLPNGFAHASGGDELQQILLLDGPQRDGALQLNAAGDGAWEEAVKTTRERALPMLAIIDEITRVITSIFD
ncbi:hypothetical protein C8F01DRAFT_1141375 [Mycena amicta]|nr:hypothetical protein C8F01DRAFT_1141375 [Mycena amicta]